jgi:hypothetical protein
MYTGIMVKRGPETSKDFLLLERNAGIVKEVNVSDNYSLTQRGKYQVKLKNMLFYCESDTPTIELFNANAKMVSSYAPPSFIIHYQMISFCLP